MPFPPHLAHRAVSVVVVLVVVLVAFASLATHGRAMPDPGTAIIERAILFNDEGWGPDRAEPDAWVPSGDGAAVTVTIDGKDVAENTFARTEGRKIALNGTATTRAEIDLFIDPDWQNVPVRAGIWVQSDASYGIIEFITGSGLGPAANQATETQIRLWDTNDSTWTNSNVAITFGDTVRLGVYLDADNDKFNYYVDGVHVGSEPTKGSDDTLDHITHVIVNHYDYNHENEDGELESGYSLEAYDVLWSDLMVTEVYDTIQDAVDAAEEGDVVEVGEGTYNENVSIGTSGITLQGAGSGVTTIAPDGGRGVQILGDSAPTTLTGITVSGFTLGAGVGQFPFISLSGTNSNPDVQNLTLSELVIENHSLGIGLNNVHDVTMSEIVLRNIDTDSNAGALELTGVQNLSVTDSIFEDNNIGIRLQDTEGLVGQPDAYGDNAGPILITNSIFTGNGTAIANEDENDAPVLVITATNNWWGGLFGPVQSQIAGEVLFDPPLTPVIQSVSVASETVPFETTSVSPVVTLVNDTGVSLTFSENATALEVGSNVITVTATLTVLGEEVATDTESVVVTRAASAEDPPADDPPAEDPPVIQDPSGVTVDLENVQTSSITPGTSTQASTTAEDGSSLSVNIPAGALPGGLPAGAELQVAAIGNPDEVFAQAPPPGDADIVAPFVVNIVDANGNPLTGEFLQPVTLTFTLPADVVPPGATGDTLMLAYWNGSVWIEVEATITVHANGTASIVAQVTHFTLFAVFVPPANWGSFLPAPMFGVNVTVWQGGTYSRLADWLPAGASVWVTSGGQFYGYIQGAPSWVNEAFLTLYPEGIPTETPTIVAIYTNV